MKASCSATGVWLLGWTSVALAQPASHLALSWDAPAGCPTAENVEARVQTLLGGGASVSSVADVRASGQVERVGNGFRLLLSMGVGSTPSSRVIEARTCDELAGAAAIAIALLARSTSADASTQAAGGDVPAPSADAPLAAPPAPPPKPDKVSDEEDEPRPSSSRELRFLLDAPIGVVGWGSLPATALGLGAGLGIRWKSLRATARGELWQQQTHRVSGFDTRFTLLSGRADACLIHELHGLELGPCLGVGLQRLVGEGVGSEVFSAGPPRTVAWVSGAAGLFASVPTPGFAHLRFLGTASVLVSPSRPRFVIEQLGAAHEPALAAPRVDLGCEWIF